MTKRRAMLVLAVLALCGVVVAGAHALERPPALQQQGGCELWHGRGSGNDRSMIDEVRICPTGPNTFNGILQHSSTEGGFGIRTIVGRVEGGTHYIFTDTGYIRNEPANGWRFCLVDPDGYRLERTSHTHLAGHYVSSDCDDHGTMTLDLVSEGDARNGMEPGGAGPAPSLPAPSVPSPSVPMPVVPPVLPTPPSPGRGFGCD